MGIRLDVVGIAVKDMPAALRFYRLLGLEIPASQDAEAHVEVAIEGLRLAWDTVDLLKQVYDTWTDEPTGHRIELAFHCGTPEDVDSTYANIVAHGYHAHKEPWDTYWGQRYAIVEDADGNLISLFA